jgi:peptidoglycan/xylan/chitin deacetylase (PgdA/CDA1 family)/glycosyltransferase involved in cell wall biosynthesis
MVEGIPVHYPRYVYPPKILRSRYGWFYWRSIRRTVDSLTRSNPPDLVLAYWVHPDGEGAVRAGRLGGVPSAVIVGGSDVQLITKRRSRHRSVTKVLNAIDLVITVNRDLKAKVEAFGVRPEKVHTWSQGVDETVFFAGSRAEARERLGVPQGDHVMLWVGRMVPVKGLETLLEGCSLLRSRQRNFRLYLVGDGPLRRNLEADCAARGLSDVVTFVGSRVSSQLGDWYRAANLFVLTSWSEGLPNVLRESLACGTPFVSSRVGGVAEIAGAFNRLFPAGDAEALANAIQASFATDACPIDQPRPATWAESAEALVRILQPEARAFRTRMESRMNTLQATQADDGGRHAEGAPSFGVRRIIRSAMAAILPKRMFIVRGPVSSSSLCLTFDDGPHPEYTPHVLDVLREQGVQATFFVVGKNVEKYADLTGRILQDGHTLGHHSFNHAEPTRTSARELIDEIRRTNDVLQSVTPEPVTLFRPPFGKVTAAKLGALWRERLSVVLWNRDPKDFATSTADELRQRLLRSSLRGGDIVLLHDNVSHTAQILPDLIRSARRAGLDFTTVDQWVWKTSPAKRHARPSYRNF